ncbi:hypothetical protein RZO55_19425 [Clostridium boliviensis]|uniref:Uncharacterized protein n=1 Tax=Clostridium boliviensis TaxID=318465 RepID=A0ABU4GQ47_9CLOT|nr:hypothetical protein [Clostridium boliviensis]MDW2799749.1 hypothetical protein [Clostridium boliviensis]
MKRIIRQWAVLSLVLIICLGISQTAYAGSVNGNEQSVLSTASGQFEKDGIIYAVKPEYINSLRSYLSQDDVDLTAEQAQAAIAEIYANVKTGIESGYLVEVGRVSESEIKSETKHQSVEAGDPKDKITEKKEEVKETQPNKKEEEKPLPQESTDIKKETVAETSPAISILELVDKAPQQNYEYLYKDTNTLMSTIQIPYRIIWGCLFVAVCLIFVSLGIVLYKQLLTKHQNRKLRGSVKGVLTLALIDLTFLVCTGIGILSGAFQKNQILSNLPNTGYYSFIYDELKRDTSVSFALLNIPSEVMDHSITYEKVVIAARQQVENDLEQGNYKANTSILIEPLKRDMKVYFDEHSIKMTNQAQKGLDLLMNRLDEKYTALLNWPFGRWWIQLKAVYSSLSLAVLGLSFVLIALIHILLLLLHHYKYHGIILAGKGMAVGSGLSMLGITAGYLLMSRKWNALSPPYMNSFFLQYIDLIWKTGMIVSGVGILLGLVEIAAGRAWKEGK